MLLSLQTGALCWAGERRRRKVSALCKWRAVSYVGPWVPVKNLPPLHQHPGLKCFPAQESILHPGRCFYTGLTQSIVVEGLGSADADQRCREGVDGSKLSFPWRAFSACFVSFLQCKAAGASDHSLLHFSSFKCHRNRFIFCGLSSSRQTPMWN